MDESVWSITWSDDLSMHNPDIDDEHKQFIELVNQLNYTILDRESKETILDIMHKILAHSELHFASEERLFSEKNFPLAEEHTQTHTQLIATFKRILAEIEKSPFSKEWIQLGLNIKNALVDHVLLEDVKYIQYLRTD